MASMREIKRRRGSIQSTQQITKAMKLVSTVKLQKARMRAENSKAYFEYMYQTVTSMLAKAGNIEHPYLRKSDSKNVAVVAVTSNRGLAGGYNANIARLIVESGIKLQESLERREIALVSLTESIDTSTPTQPFLDRKSTRLNSSHSSVSRMPSSA